MESFSIWIVSGGAGAGVKHAGENTVNTNELKGNQARGQKVFADNCAACHGADLKGTAAAPGIAARSPTYAFRQLYDFKSGARKGANSELMKPVVENLSIDDMIALVAYTASLMP